MTECKFIHLPNTVDEICLKWGCFYYNLTCPFKCMEDECIYYEEKND